MYIGEEEFFALRFNIVNNGKEPLEVFVVQASVLSPIHWTKALIRLSRNMKWCQKLQLKATAK
jgi:hypothetical protein